MGEKNDLAALYAEARERGGLIDLSGRAKWHLTGADRVRYLNGQVTNDVRHAKANSAMEACVTSAKGRLCGVIMISAEADFLRIDAETELRESMGARLERYIIADDAALQDATEEECLFHLLGGVAPAEITGARIARRYGAEGLDVIAPLAEHGRLLETLATGRVLLPAELIESIRIEAGTPRWGAELSEETLPPEAGLDARAIDYHKGCYIGQEVISRIKSVGHVNRHLAGVVSEASLAPGMTLHADGDEKPRGEITSAAWSFGLESWAALGYVKRGSADAALHARSPGGATMVPVQIRELPLIPPFTPLSPLS